MSQIGWVDFSADDRNKVRNVLALLSETGTLDELGIGQIRDAYSDFLFPGISTIQTRAKYFITVPRILRDYASLKPAKRKRYKSVVKYLADHENDVARKLAGVHTEDEFGIIGRTRIDSGGVDRRPSVIYWNGLRTFGLIKTSLSLADFCRQLDSNELHDDLAVTEHEEGSDDENTNEIRRLIHLPKYDENWMHEDNLNINLSRQEALFLKGKLEETAAISSCVPAQIFKHDLADIVLKEYDNSSIESFDVLTAELCAHIRVDPLCKKYIKLAREFSLAMEGPHLRYNLQLATNNEYDHRVDEYKEAYQEWLDIVQSNNLFSAGCADRWLSASFGEDKRTIKSGAQNFVRDCCDVLAKPNSKQLDAVVVRQAERNKGQRSLLHRKLPHDGWMGVRRLDYRWSTARRIIKDIQKGLHAST